MARTFRRHRTSHPIAEMNVTNLVDLGFTLLIIFMIATSYSKQEQTIRVNLPLESQSPQVKPPASQRFVSVSVDVAGQYFIDNDRVSFQEMRERLHRLAEQPKKPVIRIRGDAKVPYERIIQLVDELKKSGLTEITFDTATQN